MVKWSSTLRRVKNSRLVSLEDEISSINCDSDRLHSECFFHTINTVSSRYTSASCFNSSGWRWRRLAASIWGSVRPGCFTVRSIINRIIGENIVNVTSVTAITLSYTRYKLLFRKSKKVVVFNLPEPFHSSSSRKRPAWSTLALILHRCDSSSCNPVNRGCISVGPVFNVFSRDVSSFVAH